MFCDGQVLAFLFGQMTEFWSLFFSFGQMTRFWVSLNAYVHTLFNHDISNLLPFCDENLEHVVIL
jgi:hypothetical protein